MVLSSICYRSLIATAKGEIDGNVPSLGNQLGWIWKLKTRPRTHMFIWRVAKNLIPTAVWMVARHLADCSDCVWGCGTAESLQHTLIDCEMARSVWADPTLSASTEALGLSCRMHAGVVPRTLESFLSHAKQRGAVRGGEAFHMAVVATTFYYIWENRNLKKHNGAVFSKLILIMKIKVEIAAAAGISISHPSTSSEELYPSGPFVTHMWLPPQRDGS
ncbi:hypothetical protein HPP92_011724 [Vanilla planifolia]|uniref:Reverse transcriptase zinc-binding domain-containing protein n=1 Tax=Vanilla planifolia TaxID=51239 RepID=A0A835V2M7_VANPL|nr:hypothetical protein HPP92_011724 [Vanilla planifolia]